MMVAVIMGTVALAVVGALANLGVSINYTRETTISTNLSQEKLEEIKAGGFYNVVVTSATAYDSNFSPLLEYDSAFYAPETIVRGGTTFTRRVFVEKLDDDAQGNLVNMGYPHPDTGLKRVTVQVIWNKKGNWKKNVVSSLVHNPEREPLEKSVYGTVTDSVSGQPVGGVVVAARRNPGWTATTDSSGYYSFQCTGDTMRLRSSKRGFELYTSPSFAMPAYPNNNVLHDFSVVAIASRTVYGYVVANNQIVISQVNAEWSNTDPTEFLELYNPTTAAYTIDPADLFMKFVDETDTVVTATVTWINTTIPAESYFLILGSAGGDTTSPSGVTADATYYADTGSISTNIDDTKEAGVIIADGSGNIIDSLAWGNPGQDGPPSATQGDYFELSAHNVGNSNFRLEKGETLYRKALSTSTNTDMDASVPGAHVTLGNAWNTWNNNDDWAGTGGSPIPRNSLVSYTPAGGTALEGSFVMADDEVSPTVIASTSAPLGYFSLDVAIGDWTLRMASGTLAGSTEISVLAGGTSFFYILRATYTADVGFITGVTRKYSSNGFGPVLVQADPGGLQTFSDASGNYFIEVPSNETYVMTGNPGFYDPDWNTATSTFQVTVETGLLYEGVDLSIWKNGWISGRVTTNGIDGIPNVVVVSTGAFSNGNTAVTDGNGNYTIVGLRLIGNPYWVYPVIEVDQVSTPIGTSISVTQGGNAGGTDFQITGAYMYIAGDVTEAGDEIGTGVLIMASTGTINAASPPSITYSLRSGAQYYYQTFSASDGTYALQLPGGRTYNLVAWYTDAKGATSYKTAAVALPVSSGASQDFSWP